MNTFMTTLKFADDQIYMLVDALDEAMDCLEPGYEAWLADGGSPQDHPWYRLASTSAMLSHVMLRSPEMGYEGEKV